MSSVCGGRLPWAMRMAGILILMVAAAIVNKLNSWLTFWNCRLIESISIELNSSQKQRKVQFPVSTRHHTIIITLLHHNTLDSINLTLITTQSAQVRTTRNRKVISSISLKITNIELVNCDCVNYKLARERKKKLKENNSTPESAES